MAGAFILFTLLSVSYTVYYAFVGLETHPVYNRRRALSTMLTELSCRVPRQESIVDLDCNCCTPPAPSLCSNPSRKVVGQSLDPGSTAVASVMSPDPVWVTSTDDAMDALETMLESDTRHLPVSDE